MAFGCQGKNHPIDRKIDKFISVCFPESLATVPWYWLLSSIASVRALMINASAPNIYQNLPSCQRDLWQSACRNFPASEYISDTLIPAQSKCIGLPWRHPVRVSLGQGAEHAKRLTTPLYIGLEPESSANQRRWASGILSTLFSSQAACSKWRAVDLPIWSQLGAKIVLSGSKLIDQRIASCQMPFYFSA